MGGCWNQTSLIPTSCCNPQYDRRDEAQLLNVLKAIGIRVGLLVNFGRTKVEYKRLIF
ncbi:MAG: GxxExxY protein [Chthoniobacterales bacterium]